MEIFLLTPLSLLAGGIAVASVALFRFHFPFRYHYCCYFVKKNPKLVKRLLQRSYMKNKTAVGLLDKATVEMLRGSYEEAEKYLLEGIQHVFHSRGVQNRAIRKIMFNHLAWLLYYKGCHQESLSVALRLYEKFPSTPNILALIACNFARMGEIARAIDVFKAMSKSKKASASILLTCQAEIEAAKGNAQKAIQLFQQAKNKRSYASVCFMIFEIEKRIGQLRKSA